jgi:hypothetical protein
MAKGEQPVYVQPAVIADATIRTSIQKLAA